MKLFELLRDKSGEVFKLRADDSIANAAALLIEKGIGAVLVEDDNGSIVGILSERDIVRGLGPHSADLHDVRVSGLMTSDVVRCAPTDSVLQAMAMMTDRRIRHIPVFEDDKLIGIISIGDLVKCQISEVEAEAEAMRQYIAS